LALLDVSCLVCLALGRRTVLMQLLMVARPCLFIKFPVGLEILPLLQSCLPPCKAQMWPCPASRQSAITTAALVLSCCHLASGGIGCSYVFIRVALTLTLFAACYLLLHGMMCEVCHHIICRAQSWGSPVQGSYWRQDVGAAGTAASVGELMFVGMHTTQCVYGSLLFSTVSGARGCILTFISVA